MSDNAGVVFVLVFLAVCIVYTSALTNMRRKARAECNARGHLWVEREGWGYECARLCGVTHKFPRRS